LPDSRKVARPTFADVEASHCRFDYLRDDRRYRLHNDMAIRTTIQPRHLYLKPLYALVLLGLGLWGWYDYSIKIPAKQAAFEEYTRLVSRNQEFADKASLGNLSAAERTEYEANVATLNQKYKEAPPVVEAYDRPVQLWLYIIGCGILGVPFMVWPLIQMARKRYELDDDGTLRLPEGTYRIEDVTAIDMSRWMPKSIATITLSDGKHVVLDDYKYKNLHLIVGAIAHRLHPEEWTTEARAVEQANADDDDGDDGIEDSPTTKDDESER
jgi:hypothetical protein